MRRLFSICAVFGLIAASASTQPNIAGSVSDQALVQQLLRQFNVPGVSIAVINDFKVALAMAYGVADVETAAPVTTATLFQAASISKPVAVCDRKVPPIAPMFMRVIPRPVRAGGKSALP